MSEHLDNISTKIVSGGGTHLNVFGVEILANCEIASFVREHFNSPKRLRGIPLIFNDDPYRQICPRYECSCLKVQNIHSASEYCWELRV